MKRWMMIVWLVLSVGCGSGVGSAEGGSAEIAPMPTETMGPAPTSTSAPTGTPIPLSSPTLSVPVEDAPLMNERSRSDILIEGAEGLTLYATLTLPEGDGPHPGVMLLHMLGGRRSVWDQTGVAEALVDDGYAVLALDVRGHGETGSAQDWVLAEEDLRLVWRTFTELAEVDAQATAVVGASIGANMALLTMANEPALQTAVLLSPGLDYRGVMTDNRMGDLGLRPILIVASTEDVYAADSSRTLADLAPAMSQIQLYTGAGHGTNMFSAEADLLPLLRDWLEMRLKR